MTEAMRIRGVQRGTCGKTAVSLKLGYTAFLLQNTHATQALYFREAGNNGPAATADTGYTLAAGQSMPLPLRADELSLCGADAATSYELLLLD